MKPKLRGNFLPGGPGGPPQAGGRFRMDGSWREGGGGPGGSSQDLTDWIWALAKRLRGFETLSPAEVAMRCEQAGYAQILGTSFHNFMEEQDFLGWKTLRVSTCAGATFKAAAKAKMPRSNILGPEAGAIAAKAVSRVLAGQLHPEEAKGIIASAAAHDTYEPESS
jgi:hypothetical protein